MFETLRFFLKILFPLVLIFFGISYPAGASNKVVRVGVYQNKPKVFIDQQGSAKGFFIDILAYVADQEGWDLVYVPGTWEQCLIRLESKQIDLLVDVADSIERLNLFDFSREIVFSNWATMYQSEGAAIDSVLDLRGRTIVAMRGDISYQEVRNKLKNLDIICRFKEVSSFAQVFQALDKREADAGIVSRLFGLQHENQYNAKRTEVICCPNNLFFASPKNTNRVLLSAIDRHLKQLKEDEGSVYYQSLMKWIEGFGREQVPKWLLWTFSLTAVLLALFVTGFVLLRIKVNSRTAELRTSNAELEAARQRLVSQMTTLVTINNVANRLYRSLDYDTVIREAVDVMANYSRSPLVAFSEYREDTRDLKVLTSRGVENNALKAFRRLFAEETLVDQSVEGKKVCFFDDISNDPHMDPHGRKLLADAALKSICVVPLAYQDTVLGTIHLAFKQRVDMEEEQLETLLSIGKSIAMALANARHVKQMKEEMENREKAEKEKQNLQRQLLQAQKMEAIGTLAGGIAHDFNNVLQGIYGFIQIMEYNKEKDDPDLKYLKKMEGVALQAAKVVRQLLAFSREIESELKPVDLNQLISKDLTLLEKSLAKMIQVHVDLASNLDLIRADVVQVEQVLLNLCINAGHAMGENGRLTIQTKNIRIPQERAEAMGLSADSHVILTVADTGHGMSRHTMTRIFEPFFTTKTDGKGTGLGLSMVYGIVKKHNGHIACHSKPGHGTRFDIYFPAIPKNINPTPAVKEDLQGGGHETILIVDDEPTILEANQGMLNQFGYKVVTLESSEKAMVYFNQHRHDIDLVIIDVYMPNISGLRCLEQMRKIDPDIKAIVSSGKASRKIKDRALRLGAGDFLSKPYRVEDLLKSIQKVLKKKIESS